MFELSSKIAMITGGARGIGFAIAEGYVKQGATVYVLDIQPDMGQFDSHTGMHYIQVDVTQFSNLKEAADTIFSKEGRIDILVNNAGIAHIGTVENTTEEDYDKIMNVNVKGVFNALKATIPLMKQKKGGVIINIASIAALVGLPDRFLYSASKAAVLNMTVTVAKDYLEDHIRCNSISPARIHTGFVDDFISKYYPGQEAEKFEELSKTQPIGRMGTPAEVANLAIFLASDEAAFITGTDYPLDGGFTKLNT